MEKVILTTETLINVRFSEVDSMGVVWHGYYIRYFEDGREDFGIKYNLSYLDFHRQGILIPIVKVQCDYKRPLTYGDSAFIETRFVDCEGAKIQYDYTIYSIKYRDVVATGTSIQVFLDLNRDMLLAIPLFFLEWKKRNGLITEIQKSNL